MHTKNALLKPYTDVPPCSTCGDGSSGKRGRFSGKITTVILKFKNKLMRFKMEYYTVTLSLQIFNYYHLIEE